MRPFSLTLILLALLALVWASGRTEKASDHLTQTIDELMADQTPVPKLISKWNDADGIEHKVETPREKDSNGEWEPASEWAAKHKYAVDTLKALFPPGTV